MTNNWISVFDSKYDALPCVDDEILYVVVGPNNKVSVNYGYVHSVGQDECSGVCYIDVTTIKYSPWAVNGPYEKITHWMKMPQPPVIKFTRRPTDEQLEHAIDLIIQMSSMNGKFDEYSTYRIHKILSESLFESFDEFDTTKAVELITQKLAKAQIT